MTKIKRTKILTKRTRNKRFVSFYFTYKTSYIMLYFYLIKYNALFFFYIDCKSISGTDKNKKI